MVFGCIVIGTDPCCWGCTEPTSPTVLNKESIGINVPVYTAHHDIVSLTERAARYHNHHKRNQWSAWVPVNQTYRLVESRVTSQACFWSSCERQNMPQINIFFCGELNRAGFVHRSIFLFKVEQLNRTITYKFLTNIVNNCNIYISAY